MRALNRLRKQCAFTSVAALLALTGCTRLTESPVATIQYTTQPPSTISTETLPGKTIIVPTPLPAQSSPVVPISNKIDYPLDTYTFTGTDGDGFVTQYTCKLGRWIKGSDTEFIKSAWKSVGGQNEFPPLSDYIIENGNAYYGDFDYSRGACAFGTVMIADATPNWNRTVDWTAKLLLNMRSDFQGISSINGYFAADGGFMIRGREYSNKAGAEVSRIENNVYWPLVSASIESGAKSWGPLPIVLAVENVFSPNYPEGNPDFDSIRINLKSGPAWDFTAPDDITNIAIGKTWGDGEDTDYVTTVITPTAEPTETSKLTPSPIPEPIIRDLQNKNETYTVIAGDSLAKIAEMFYGDSSYLNIQKIIDTNGLGDSDSVSIGQVLIIP